MISRRALPALLLAACSAAQPAAAPFKLQYLTTAQQFGVISFRDPLAALSPDGTMLAWSVQRHLYLRRVEGGPITELATEPGLIQHLAWRPDSKAIAAAHRYRTPRWWLYDLASGGHAPLFPPGHRGGSAAPLTDSLTDLAWSPDGRRTAGVRDSAGGSQLWILGGDSAEVIRSTASLSHPVFAPDGRLVCMARDGKRQFLRDPCIGQEPKGDRLEAYNAVAFSPGGDTIYYAAPNAAGVLDLWARGRRGGVPVRLAAFSRDAYAPSAGKNGTVLFKTQTYRANVGVVPDTGGAITMITNFQSETPSWDPTGQWIGITYGTWRRFIDDFAYPDISQDNGIVSAHPDTMQSTVVRMVDNSVSEDQSLCWSPNGKWIAYHSHKDQGDDIYLVPADKSKPDRRITSFGRGFETGWPRWSPDGKWLVFDSDSRVTHQTVIYLVGVDQETGAITVPERELKFDGYSGKAVHAEWLGGSDRLAVLGDESAESHVIVLSPRDGGRVSILRRWKSEHLFSGLGVSPDGKWVAFIAPGADLHFQLWRMPAAGGEPRQLTFDPTNKTQPSYSPNGKEIAVTIWDYEMQFWLTTGRRE